MRQIALVVLLAAAGIGHAAEVSLVVPTDRGAKYSVLEVTGKWPNRTILTKRVGSSGTSYSRRLYNCSNHTFKYLATGDTIAELAKSKADPAMGPLVSGSISDYVGKHACKR
jgi:hypothetical protein